MQTEKIRIEDLVSPSYNPRTITSEEMKKLKDSINEFGYVDPIIVNRVNNHIVGGNQRYLALKELGYTEVDVIFIEEEDLNREKALNIALNKISGEWDNEKLETIFQDLEFDGFDLSFTGFDNVELEDFNLERERADDVDSVIEDDYEAEDDIPVTVELGDLYQLGNHRLYCGDSTIEENVSILMDGVKADMVFTDPPYNINYSGIKDKRTIKNDKMEDDEFVEFLKKSLPYCDTSYICCSWQYAHLFKEAMNQLDMPPKAMIIWDKVNPAQNLDKYYKQHEIIWYYGKFGGEKTIRGDIWECKRQPNTFHPTMKPIELISMAIQDNPNKQNIYDGFGGSGSTLIACEQLNRQCYMMELDPYYCQVIINRWEAFTGQKAKKLN